jgi:hypothetical protein
MWLWVAVRSTDLQAELQNPTSTPPPFCHRGRRPGVYFVVSLLKYLETIQQP